MEAWLSQLPVSYISTKVSLPVIFVCISFFLHPWSA